MLGIATLDYVRRVAKEWRNFNENSPLDGMCDTPCLHIQTFRRIVYEVRKERINENGAMAQLVAHLHGMERVRGSNPLSSTMRCLVKYLSLIQLG